MSETYRPPAGQITLVEYARPGRDPDQGGAVTGSVVEDSESEWHIALDRSGADLADGTAVTISVFASDALYRMRGTAECCSAGHLALQPMYEVERIQRRFWPRLALQISVTLAMLEVSDPDFTGVVGRTIDIGVGGLQVETVRRLPSGSPTVIMTLPDGLALVARTRVVESDDADGGYRYRLAFDQIESADTNRLMAMTGTST